ncbi:MAG: cell division protein ZipA [Pseudomonadota bacterium]
MDGLRWILLGIGAVIIAGIYITGTRKSQQATLRDSEDDELPRDAPPLDEDMERELARLGQLITEEREGAADPETAPVADADDAAEPVDLPEDPDKIVTLLLKAAGASRLHGPDIADAAEKAGLTFGDRGIYHRMMDRGDSQVVVFSMANITNPGTFDPGQLATTFSPGLCLFMTLPNSLSALDTWDAMYAAGQRLADLLECQLLDEASSSLSRQRVAHIRDEMREYDRGAE